MAQVCIVGAGFLGTNLARHLLERGDRVRLFGHPPPWPEALEGCELIAGELADGEALAAALAGCERLYHLVGSVDLPAVEARRIDDLGHSVGGSLALFERALAAGVERVVFISSGGAVYGVPERLPIDEMAPQWPISSYGAAKLAVERYLHVYHRQHGLDYRIARLGNPFGPFQRPGRGQGVVAALLDAALTGRPFPLLGDGAVVRDYLYVEDACAALARLGEYDGGERVFNVGSGEGRSLSGMIHAVEGATGRPLQLDRRPARPLDVPACVLDVRRARERLGWSPETPLEEALQHTAEWLKAWGGYA
ncbi:NAD-dependent epimerase/dehydratase family protein [Endothiovibrio diazotrophicus]